MTEMTRLWLRGLVATVINGFASGVVLIVADPNDFNLGDGAPKLLMTSSVFAILGLANYLKQHPLPDDDDTISPRRLGVVLLPWLLVGGVGLTSISCAGAVKPPVITQEDQAQVRAVAAQVLGGIEVAGLVTRDGRQLVADLATLGVVAPEVRGQVNAAVIRSNGIVQAVITELATVTRQAEVGALARRAAVALTELADLLERQADVRVQTAGRFLRSAVRGLIALVEVQS